MISVALSMLLAAAPAARADSPGPTFGRDVAPILDAHCVGCHRAGGIAAMLPLLTYAETRAAAPRIRDAVSRRRMPPWPADPARSVPMRNDLRLEQAQIDTLLRWVDAGAPEGEHVERTAPAIAQGWGHPQGRPPDLVFSFPKFPIPATGELPYLQALIPVGISEDRWIIAMQALPGNPSVVHHMGIAEERLGDNVRPGDIQQLETVARRMGLPSKALLSSQPAVVDHEDPAVFDMLATYTPGTTFEAYAPGTAKLLKGGAAYYISFNVHYTTTGQPQTDGSKLGLWLQKTAPQRQLFRFPSPGRTILANGKQLLTDDPGTRAEGTDVAIPPIPPFAHDYELVGVTAYTHPVTLYQLQPHAHLRARDFSYRVVYPDGRQETLLTVPEFDYHWQLSYELAKPVHLPAGSKMIVVAHYDNSQANAHLREAAAKDPERRCGPDKQVLFRDQNQTWDEMFSPMIQFAADQPARAHGTRLVSTVGCLVRKAEGPVWLESASAPADTQAQSTSHAELAQLHGTGLGRAAVRLLGTEPFERPAKPGAKVAVKGVLIPSGAEVRINVTSLQVLADACE